MIYILHFCTFCYLTHSINVIMRNQNSPLRTFPLSGSSSRFQLINDGKSMMMNESELEDDGDIDLNLDENLHIYNWMKCRSKVYKKYICESVAESTANNNCYMVQIDEIMDICYRKKFASSWQKDKDKDKLNHKKNQLRKDVEQSNNIYLKIIANFYSEENLEYSTRTVQFNIIQLQHKSGLIYKVSFPNIAIFFHSKFTSENKYKIRIELTVIQSKTVDSFQLVENQQYLGFCDIDPFKSFKNKQKTYLRLRKMLANLQTFVQYTVIVSDSFKVLERLIPPNCLCSSQESIPGVVGRKLPNNISNLYQQIQHTELHSLRLDVVNIDIPEIFFSLKLRQVEQLSKAFESKATALATIKEVKLNVIFHNGWTIFSQNEIKLQLKVDHSRINIKKSQKSSAQLMKIKHYSGEAVCLLPFIFFDEEALIILQVMTKIQIKKKTDKTESTNSMIIPLCYSYYANYKLGSDDKQTRILLLGDGLNTEGVTSKLNSQGKIQFYISIQQANKLNLSNNLIANNAIITKSQTQTERMMMEKQRMIKENNKLRHQNRIKKIQLNQQIPLLDTTSYKQNLYRDEISKLKQERKEKEELLEYLKKKVNEVDPQFKEKNIGKINQNVENEINYQKRFINPNFSQNFHNSIFYQAILQKRQNIDNKNQLFYSNIDSFQVHPFSIMKRTSNIYISGETPIETIKTELLQKEYSYVIFINWISLIPVTEAQKLPRKFIFQINFFNKNQLKSCTCSVKESTGEIIVNQSLQSETKNDNKNNNNPQKQKQKQTNSKKQTEKSQQQQQNNKIFSIEIGPNPKTNNNDTNFLQFISYLYHSELQIKIIDALSMIQFGECFFPLKDLIRIRRNQCTAIRDIWVTRTGYTKAKLKMEIRSFRKLASTSLHERPPDIEKLEILSMQPEARQLLRIAHFKNSRLGSKSASLNKVQQILNEKLTKQQLTINVNRMRGQFISLTITNHKNHIQSYKIAINDPDRPYLNNQQLVVVNDIMMKSFTNTRWWKYLCQLNLIQSKDHIMVDERNNFRLDAGQTRILLLHYYTDRKYEGEGLEQFKYKTEESNQEQTTKNTKISMQAAPSQIFRVYNHNRCINLTLTNTQKNSLHSIYKINIVSEPDNSTFTYEIARKSNSKLMIKIPFKSSQKYVLYIDDPTVISTMNQNQNCVYLDCFIGDEGSQKKINVSILSPFPENRLLINYKFMLRGVREISIEGRLWQTEQILVDFHSSIYLKKGLQNLLVLSEDENIVAIRDKNPIKVNQKQAKTMVRMSVTPSSLGINYYQLNIINPLDYSVIYRYCLKLTTQQPQIKQKIPIKIRVSDKMMEYSFGFKNEVSRKLKLQVLSTHPHILWSTQQIIEVEARSQKIFQLKINSEQISSSTNVILTLMQGKKIFHYLFAFQINLQL